MDNGASSYHRFLDGDENGFVEIVRDYKDGLILYLDSFVRNITVAEELTEDTFVRLGIKKPHFSEKSSFRTWLYAIGRKSPLTISESIQGLTRYQTMDVPGLPMLNHSKITISGKKEKLSSIGL